MGVAAGIAELDDVAAVGACRDLAHRLPEWRHEAVVVQGRVFSGDIRALLTLIVAEMMPATPLWAKRRSKWTQAGDTVPS